jgi:hypothetical protein
VYLIRDKSTLDLCTQKEVEPGAHSDALISRYLSIRGLRWTNVSSMDAQTLFSIGSPLKFNLLDGDVVVYFGLFQHENAKEVAFPVRMRVCHSS